jgi:hypothetical protein
MPRTQNLNDIHSVHFAALTLVERHVESAHAHLGALVDHDNRLVSQSLTLLVSISVSHILLSV